MSQNNNLPSQDLFGQLPTSTNQNKVQNLSQNNVQSIASDLNPNIPKQSFNFAQVPYQNQYPQQFIQQIPQQLQQNQANNLFGASQQVGNQISQPQFPQQQQIPLNPQQQMFNQLPQDLNRSQAQYRANTNFLPQRQYLNNNINQSYLNNSQQLEEEKQFCDDEEIELKLKKQKVKGNNLKVDLEKKLKLSLQSLTKALKLSSSQVQTLPIQIELETDEKENGNLKQDEVLDLDDRPNIDLICVIDKSGSMQGQKIDLVQKTLNYLTNYLNKEDRISLVTFDHQGTRLLPLLRVSDQNKQRIEGKIKSIDASGGTNIVSGMNLALKMIKERKFKNQVTSIFLLSDGQDKAASGGLKACLEKYKIEDNFSINSFGFGGDHDPVLMNEIAKLGDGQFYYVEKLDQVDEMFVDALGGLFSVIAQKVHIELKINSSQNKIFSDVTINKTYGEMWKKQGQGSAAYFIDINQLIGGVTKQFLFEIQVPPIDQKLQDFERNASFIECTLQAFSLDEEKKEFNTKATLQLAVYNEDENIVPEINEEVQINVLRVQGAEVLDQAREMAEQGKFDKGQEMMDKFQNNFLNLKPQQQEKLQLLSDNIKQCKQSNSNRQDYERVGKMQLISMGRCNMEQRSQAVNVKTDYYQSSMQKQMVQNQQLSKKK